MPSDTTPPPPVDFEVSGVLKSICPSPNHPLNSFRPYRVSSSTYGSRSHGTGGKRFFPPRGRGIKRKNLRPYIVRYCRLEARKQKR